MRFSIFTPTHRPAFLNEAFDSLLAQSQSDWEWVLVPGDYPVELDYDDLLTPEALAKIGAAIDATGPNSSTRTSRTSARTGVARCTTRHTGGSPIRSQCTGGASRRCARFRRMRARCTSSSLRRTMSASGAAPRTSVRGP